MDKIDAITKKLIEQKKLEESARVAEAKANDGVEEIEEKIEDVVTGFKGGVDGESPKDVEDAVKHVELGSKKTKDTPVDGAGKVKDPIGEDVVVHIHTDTEEVYIEEPEYTAEYEEPSEDEFEYYESEELEHVTLEKKKLKEDDDDEDDEDEDDDDDDDEDDDDDKKKESKKLKEGKKPSKDELLKRFGKKKAKPFKDDDDKEDDKDDDKEDDKEDDKKKDKKEESRKFDEKKLEALFQGYINKSYGELSESFDTPRSVKITEAFLNRQNSSLDLTAMVVYEGKETETVISLEDFDTEHLANDGKYEVKVSENTGVLFGSSDDVTLTYEIKEGVVNPNYLNFDVKLFAEGEEIFSKGKIVVKEK